MKMCTIHDLRDSAILSLALHQALVCLRTSPLRISGSHICRLINLDTADLSRMRRLYRHPKYRRSVCLFKIWRVLHYLVEQFPTLVLFEDRKGLIRARLYKRYMGQKLIKSIDQLRPPLHPFASSHKKGKAKQANPEAGANIF